MAPFRAKIPLPGHRYLSPPGAYRLGETATPRGRLRLYQGDGRLGSRGQAVLAQLACGASGGHPQRRLSFLQVMRQRPGTGGELRTDGAIRRGSSAAGDRPGVPRQLQSPPIESKSSQGTGRFPADRRRPLWEAGGSLSHSAVRQALPDQQDVRSSSLASQHPLGTQLRRTIMVDLAGVVHPAASRSAGPRGLERSGALAGGHLNRATPTGANQVRPVTSGPAGGGANSRPGMEAPGEPAVTDP